MGGQGCCGKREVRTEEESDAETEGAEAGISRSQYHLIEGACQHLTELSTSWALDKTLF